VLDDLVNHAGRGIHHEADATEMVGDEAPPASVALDRVVRHVDAGRVDARPIGESIPNRRTGIEPYELTPEEHSALFPDHDSLGTAPRRAASE
jgi:hypothetical protein